MDWINSAVDQVKNKVDMYRGSDLEKKVKLATSTDPWHAPNSLKTEIAMATFNYEGYREVMDIVWKKLSDPPEMHVSILKALALLEHFLRCGPERVINDMRSRQYTIQRFQDFSYHDGQRDRSAGIVDTAKRICHLLNDEEELGRVREEFEQNQQKYTSMGSGGGGSDGYSGGYGQTYSKYGGIGGGSSGHGQTYSSSAGTRTTSAYEDDEQPSWTKSKYGGMGSDSVGGFDDHSTQDSRSSDRVPQRNQMSSESTRRNTVNTQKSSNINKTRKNTGVGSINVKKPVSSSKTNVIKPLPQSEPQTTNDDFADDPFTAAATTNTASVEPTAAPVTNDEFGFPTDFNETTANTNSVDVFASLEQAPVSTTQTHTNTPHNDPFSMLAASAGTQQNMNMNTNTNNTFDIFASGNTNTNTHMNPSHDVFGGFSSATPAAPVQNNDIWANLNNANTMGGNQQNPYQQNPYQNNPYQHNPYQQQQQQQAQQQPFGFNSSSNMAFGNTSADPFAGLGGPSTTQATPTTTQTSKPTTQNAFDDLSW